MGASARFGNGAIRPPRRRTAFSAPQAKRCSRIARSCIARRPHAAYMNRMFVSKRLFAASSAILLVGLAAAPGVASAFDLVSALRGGDGEASASRPSLPDGARAALALVPGWRDGDGRHVAGLDIRLAPGWKTYWRVPGEAGVPPYFDWTGSENVAAVEVSWPKPTTFETYGFTTLGYEDAVTLPLRVEAQDPSRPVSLRLEFAYGLCADICIPAQDNLTLDLPAEGGEDAAARPSIEAALALSAAPAEAMGVAVETCALSADPADRRLEAVFHLPEAPSRMPMAVVEGPESLWFEPAEVALDGRVLRVTAAVDPLSPALDGGWMARDALRVTLLGEGRALETKDCGA